MNLKILRAQHDMSQAELANALKIKQNTLSNYENGTTQPEISLILKIADFFNCSVDYLLGHQTQNVLYLDSLTNEQREAVKLIKQLDNRQVLKVIGYIERIKDTPFEEVVSKLLKKEE